MFHSMKLFTAAVAVAALAQVSYAGGYPGFSVVKNHVDVAFGDLNLNDARDAGVALGRIKHAAAQACGRMPERDRAYYVDSQFVTRKFVKCRDEAVSKAVGDLNAPVVSRVYAEVYKTPNAQITQR